MPPPSDGELVRFITGAASGAEARRIEDWFSASEVNRARADAIRAIWEVLRPDEDSDVEGMWAVVRDRMDAAGARPVVVDFAPRAERPLWAFVLRHRHTGAIAAAFLVAITSGIAVRQMERASRTIRVRARVVTEYSTGRGERVTIQLSDSSRITLAPLTRVRILPGFGVRLRELIVSGEAMLDVVHDDSRPFRVYAGAAVAEDIGTRFAIRAYTGDSAVSVTVGEGAVSLGQARARATTNDARAPEGVVVRAGEYGQLRASGRVSAHREQHPADQFAWTDGNLAFDDVPLNEVITTLERWFDVHVVVPDAAMKARRITAHFEGQSAHAIIGAMAITLGAELQWRGNIVTVTEHR